MKGRWFVFKTYDRSWVAVSVLGEFDSLRVASTFRDELCELNPGQEFFVAEVVL